MTKSIAVVCIKNFNNGNISAIGLLFNKDLTSQSLEIKQLLIYEAKYQCKVKATKLVKTKNPANFIPPNKVNESNHV